LPDGKLLKGNVLKSTMKPVDIAIVEVDNPKGEKLPFVEIADVEKNEMTVMLGYPGMHGRAAVDASEVIGGMGKGKDGRWPMRSISTVTQVQDTQVVFKAISAPALPGNSGGPLFNLEGKVVGIVVRSDLKSLGYATPSKWIKKYMDEIKSSKTSRSTLKQLKECV
jgi:S1-C subfamily serine protease